MNFQSKHTSGISAMRSAPVNDVNVIDLMSSIRGIAALIVAAVHTFQVFTLPYFGLYGPAHLTTSFLATYAVIAFFIVSGFMIYLSISRHKDDCGLFDMKSFFLARAFRIYPPLLASVIIYISAKLAKVIENRNLISSVFTSKLKY